MLFSLFFMLLKNLSFIFYFLAKNFFTKYRRLCIKRSKNSKVKLIFFVYCFIQGVDRSNFCLACCQWPTKSVVLLTTKNACASTSLFLRWFLLYSPGWFLCYFFVDIAQLWQLSWSICYFCLQDFFSYEIQITQAAGSNCHFMADSSCRVLENATMTTQFIHRLFLPPRLFPIWNKNNTGKCLFYGGFVIPSFGKSRTASCALLP